MLLPPSQNRRARTTVAAALLSATVLGGFPATRDTRYLLSQLRRLFSVRVVEQITLLDSLVPEYPPMESTSPNRFGGRWRMSAFGA